MWGDRGQHVVAGEHDAVGGVEQAEVIVRVAGGVESHPFAAAEGDDLGVVDAPGRRRGAHEPTERDPEELHLHPPLQRRAEHRVAAPRHRSAERGRDWCAVARLVRVERLLLAWIEPRAEAAMRDHLGAVGVAHPTRAAEVVGVRVGDDHRVHVLGLVARPLEPVDEGSPRLWPGHPRVDDRHAPLVLEEVAVHVAEAREHDRELRPQDAGRDLGDLRASPAPAPGGGAGRWWSPPWERTYLTVGSSGPVGLNTLARYQRSSSIDSRMSSSARCAVAFRGVASSAPGYQRRVSSLMVDTSTER